jgi:hypothetical protein
VSELRVLASGIDSLFASVRGQLIDGVLVALADVRALNPDTEVSCSFDGGPADLLLRRYGWRGYPFWFRSPRYELHLGASEPFPPAYVQLHAEHIHAVGIEAAVEEVEIMLRRDFFPGGCRAVASRVDVFADQQGWVPQHDDFHRFRCRALRRRTFEVPRQQHGYGRRLSGFTFGKGDLLARIYDKTLEAAVTGKTWPELLWESRDPERPVWRVEFQFRRPVLASMGLNGMADVIRHRQGLWDYGTRWLTLRKRVRDSNLSRWPVAPEWVQLSAAGIGGSAEPLIRERVREAQLQRLTQGLVGYASSVEAMGGARRVGGALTATVPSVHPYLTHRGASFAELVGVKRQRRLDVRASAASGDPS